MPSVALTAVDRGFTGFNFWGSDPYGGVAYGTPPVGDNGKCVASFTPDTDGTYSLMVGTSTEPDNDLACGYIRDYSGANPVTLTKLFTQSGDQNKQYTVAIPAGYSIDIEYTRDSSTGGGDNSIFVALTFSASALTGDFDQSYQPPDDNRYIGFEAGNFAPDGSSGFKAANFTDESSGAFASLYAPRSGTAVIQYRLVSNNPTYGFSIQRPSNWEAIADAVANVGWQTIEVAVAFYERLNFTFYANGYIYPPWEGNSAEFTIHMKEEAQTPQTVPAYLTLSTLISIACTAILSGVKIPLPIHSAATIGLLATPRLKTFKYLQSSTALLAVYGAHKTPHAPPGLNGALRIIKDPVRKDVILDQYLDIWFDGDPNLCQVTMSVDGAPETTPTTNWTNQGTCSPAILRIDSAAIPDDNQTHKITIAVWQLVGAQSSPRATKTLLAKTSSIRSAECPEWCGAELIRQATADVGELSKVFWRHDGAVQIVAKYQVMSPSNNTVFIDKIATIGFGAHDQSHCFVDDIALKIGYVRGGQARPVYFGVSSMHNGQFGPVTWTTQPIMVFGRVKPQEAIPTSPDAATLTEIDEWGLISAVNTMLQGQLTAPPANLSNIIMYTYRKLRDRVKGIVCKGGTAHIAELGKFSASWNKDQTARGITFTPSTGFKAGTRAGQVMTDQEAKDA